MFIPSRLFNEESLKDYDRFRKQEVRDLREVLSAHIKTQIKLCKLVRVVRFCALSVHVLLLLSV